MDGRIKMQLVQEAMERSEQMDTHECLKVSTAIRSGLVDKSISPDLRDVAMRALVTLQQRMNAIAGIPNMPQKALGLNMDTTNGHEVEAKLAREDLVQRMFKAKDAGDEATAKRYEKAIVETDRKNKEARDRAAEIIVKRVDYVPPSAEERRAAHFKEVDRIRKEARDYNTGKFE